MVSFTLLLGKSHHYILERMMGGPQNQSRNGGEHRNLCHYQESNTNSATTDWGRLLVNSFKERTTYSLSNLSFPPLTTLKPSGDQSTANTSSEWPGRSTSNLCVFMFHTAVQTNRLYQLTFAGIMPETVNRQDMVSHK